VHIDHFGPLNTTDKDGKPTDYRHVLVITDSLSMNCRLIATKTTTAMEACAHIWKEWVIYYGKMDYLISDNGPGYANFLCKSLTKMCGYTHLRTSVRNAKSNSRAELSEHMLMILTCGLEDFL